MTLNEIKILLPTLDNMVFQLENGSLVPEHFHVTEVGMVTKHFIDCGGIIRNEKTVNFQLWNANDLEHRLKPGKLLKIIALSEDKLGLEDAEIEVEYQQQTIGKFGLGFANGTFVLLAKNTACLAQDACGTSQAKPKINLSQLSTQNTCAPGTGCC